MAGLTFVSSSKNITSNDLQDVHKFVYIHRKPHKYSGLLEDLDDTNIQTQKFSPQYSVKMQANRQKQQFYNLRRSVKKLTSKKNLWITNEQYKQITDEFREYYQGIIDGINTASQDNLTTIYQKAYTNSLKKINENKAPNQDINEMINLSYQLDWVFSQSTNQKILLLSDLQSIINKLIEYKSLLGQIKINNMGSKRGQTSVILGGQVGELIGINYLNSAIQKTDQEIKNSLKNDKIAAISSKQTGNMAINYNILNQPINIGSAQPDAIVSTIIPLTKNSVRIEAEKNQGISMKTIKTRANNSTKVKDAAKILTISSSYGFWEMYKQTFPQDNGVCNAIFNDLIWGDGKKDNVKLLKKHIVSNYYAMALSGNGTSINNTSYKSQSELLYVVNTGKLISMYEIIEKIHENINNNNKKNVGVLIEFKPSKASLKNTRIGKMKPGNNLSDAIFNSNKTINRIKKDMQIIFKLSPTILNQF